jgi:hypothetical protein
MASYSDGTMDRLDRLEASVTHITEILVLQNERVEIGFSNLREEMTGMRQEMTGMRQEMTGMRQEMTGMRAEMRTSIDSVRDETRMMREAMTDRLDRLIAITVKERTLGVERLASIEERLARLESHVGL